MLKKHGNSKPGVKNSFIEWCALPDPLRDPKTQRDFAKQHGVSEVTLSHWREDDDFWQEVERRIRKWGKDKVPNVIASLYRGVIRDKKAGEVKLYLEWITNWREKTEIESPQLNQQVEELRLVLKSMIEGIKKSR